ncbi:hypothetical protein [Sorangium sp. So ce861]|uniref:hypothetical protein n=1 Tax=Sorangium sp. So ce861 TaxID=3133323 RepID=UPI003F5E74EE
MRLAAAALFITSACDVKVIDVVNVTGGAITGPCVDSSSSSADSCSPGASGAVGSSVVSVGVGVGGFGGVGGAGGFGGGAGGFDGVGAVGGFGGGVGGSYVIGGEGGSAGGSYGVGGEGGGVGGSYVIGGEGGSAGGSYGVGGGSSGVGGGEWTPVPNCDSHVYCGGELNGCYCEAPCNGHFLSFSCEFNAEDVLECECVVDSTVVGTCEEPGRSCRLSLGCCARTFLR